jgi:hypothetical protein
MKDFKLIDWKGYNRPPYLQQWMSIDDTKKLVSFGDKNLEDVNQQVLGLKDEWDLPTARGWFLDRIGKLMNEKRSGNTDEYYRNILKLRTMLNTNDGTVNSIIKTIKFLYQSEVVHIVPNYPAGLIIEHDGEGTPDLNFNKLLTEIIAAGVSYFTKELFEFTERVTLADIFWLEIIRKDIDRFGSPIKFNGAVKFDGKTANGKITVKGKFNGRFKFNGDLSFRGISVVPAPYQPKPPFKFSSRILDDLGVTVRRDDPADNLEIDEGVFIGIRKHHTFNGACKFDGAIQFDSMALIPWE